MPRAYDENKLDSLALEQQPPQPFQSNWLYCFFSIPLDYYSIRRDPMRTQFHIVYSRGIVLGLPPSREAHSRAHNKIGL